MVFWRISNYADLSGLGSQISNGRWHTASTEHRVVYLAEHPAVSLLENLANLGVPPDLLPDEFQLLKIKGPDDLSIEELSDIQISKIHSGQHTFTRAVGNEWLKRGFSCLLRVPSIPSPESWNYLLNPLHPDASQIRIEWARTVTYDRRLFQLSK